MSNQFTKVPLPTLKSIQVTVEAPNLVRMSGTITTRDPSKDLTAFFSGLHEAALEDHLTELRIDITRLTFINSSSIRLFVDWTSWLRNVPSERRYLLKFKTSRQITWQKACFSALLTIAKDLLAIEDAP